MKNWSRKKKLLLWLFALLLAAALLLSSVEFPNLNAEIAFRKTEKENLVGPSEIIGQEDTSYWFNTERAIIGQTEYGYCLFEYQVFDDGRIAAPFHFQYRAKGTDVTLMGSGGYHPHVYMDDLYMPIFMFCETPSAVYAELELFVQYQPYRGDLIQNTYVSVASRGSNGYFVFKMDFSGEVDLSSVDYIHYRLSRSKNLYPGMSGTATVRLYDKNGDLLDTHILDLNE